MKAISPTYKGLDLDRLDRRILLNFGHDCGLTGLDSHVKTRRCGWVYAVAVGKAGESSSSVVEDFNFSQLNSLASFVGTAGRWRPTGCTGVTCRKQTASKEGCRRLTGGGRARLKEITGITPDLACNPDGLFLCIYRHICRSRHMPRLSCTPSIEIWGRF